MSLFANTPLLALAAGLTAGLVTSFALGMWRGGGTEVGAGLHALCGMKWRDFAHLIEDLLHDRGFASTNDERRPGEGGFDLMMTRGSFRYLVDCKNGAAHRVTEQSVRELAALVEMQGAGGAVLATTGKVDAAASQLAANRRIEILTGADLWRQVKPWVPQDLRNEAEKIARGGFARRAALTAASAAIVGLLVLALFPAPLVTPTPAPAATAAATAPVAQPVVAARAPQVVAPTAPIAMPDASLSEDQLAARRSRAAMEVRGNPIVDNAVWPTKSTLVVSLRQPGAEIPDLLFDETCRILVQYEEMRYTRLQIESPSTEPSGAATVRWRQCR